MRSIVTYIIPVHFNLTHVLSSIVCALTSGMGILLGVALLLVAQSCVASCAAVLGPGR